MGSSNPAKRRQGALPIVKDAQGQPCKSPDAALDRWIEHFSTIEGGTRVENARQRELWIANLEHFRAESFDIKWHELPSLVDIERACRQVSKGKATGPDGVPSDVVHHLASPIAKHLYPMLLKLLTHGQESLLHKGGRLAVAWKKKGAQDLCDSYRSLLVSSHPAKAMHKCLRSGQVHLYEKYMQRQQLGGRRKVPVTLAVHLTRAFLRVQHHQHRSAGILYLDLKEAFYRIIRPLVVDVTLTDEILAQLVARLGLPAQALHELHGLLSEEGALERAGLDLCHRRAIAAIHSDTHFSIPGQRDCTRTQAGTRPGDSWADVVFGFAWARLLHKLQDDLINCDVLEHYTDRAPWKPFHDEGHEDGQQIPFIGPTWMDDLSLCVAGVQAAEVERRLGVAASTLIDHCQAHGMTPNLAKGKTEMLMSLRGGGSRQLKRRYFGGQSSGLMPVIGNEGVHHITVVGEYVHLGNLMHHSGKDLLEIKRRLAIAHTTFTDQRRRIFHNPTLTFGKKKELFDSLILSSLMYGAETWVLGDWGQREYFHAGVIRLYKRLCAIKHDAHITDEDLLGEHGLLSPSELLRRQRLRYVTTLYQCPAEVTWQLIAQDLEWTELVRADFSWLYAQLSRTTQLPDPTASFQPWYELICHHTSYWKRLLRRAFTHATKQRTNDWHVLQTHIEVIRALENHGELVVPPPAAPASPEQGHYGCLLCQTRCKTLGGEGAHMFKVHGVRAPHRHLCQGTQCGHCLTEFHTIGRLTRHMKHSEECRQALSARGMNFEAEPGIGSYTDACQERAHNGLKVHQVAQGPRLPPGAPVHADRVDPTCLQLLGEYLLDIDRPEAATTIRQSLRRQPLAWTNLVDLVWKTFENLTDEEWDIIPLPRAEVQRCLGRLVDPTTWTLFQVHAPGPRLETRSHMGRIEYENWIVELCGYRGGPWKQWPSIPRPAFREKIIMHAFSGRRRHGDVQFFLDRASKLHPECIIQVVSVDIIIDPIYGDVCAPGTRGFWLNGVRQGWVIGLLAGPPCNTWSIARTNAVFDRRGQRGPRVVRTAEELWGMACLSLRELDNVGTGNELLCFSVLALLHLSLTSGLGILEHPIEPEDDTAASIWRLPVTHLLRCLPEVHLHEVSQGLFGAQTAKPTGLLVLGMPDFIPILHQWRVTTERPSGGSIGLSTAGDFKTATLKEYPPALCGGLAESFRQTIVQRARSEVEAPSIPEAFRIKCSELTCMDYGEVIGPDYAAG